MFALSESIPSSSSLFPLFHIPLLLFPPQCLSPQPGMLQGDEGSCVFGSLQQLCVCSLCLPLILATASVKIEPGSCLPKLPWLCSLGLAVGRGEGFMGMSGRAGLCSLTTVT